MAILATASSRYAICAKFTISRPLCETGASLLLGCCLLLTASGLLYPSQTASARQDDVKVTRLLGPRTGLPALRGSTSGNFSPYLDAEQTDLRDALATLSRAARLSITGDVLEKLGSVPVVLSLDNQTAVRALRAIMAQVPGGGFAFVEEQDNTMAGRAYVLGGLSAGLAARASSIVSPEPRRPPPAASTRTDTPRARDEQQIFEAEYLANELLLEFPPELDGRDVQDIVRAFGGKVSGVETDLLTKIGYHRVRFPDGTDVVAIAPILVTHTSAKAAEPNYVAKALFPIPNDPLFIQQWGLIRTEVPSAWGLALGEEDTLVAILDSGVDSTHPELEHALTDGWDFIDSDDEPFDDEGHGTAMAGIIAAGTDNEQGIAGIAPGITLMPVRVLDGSGKGTYAEVISGLIYAADRGARVINMSFGGYGESRALSLALAYAHRQGTLLIGAAGNEGVNGRVFPAADPRVIGVASTNASDELSEISNWGMHVLLAAPGERIPTLLPNGEYAWVSGTSAAAAHITGIAALAFSVNPELLNVQCAQLLVDTAEDLGPSGWDENFGFGQVNAAQAIDAAAHR